ncbi:hypothetical protein [Bacillus cereus group sp. N21]|nr:hypothetical protein [Bacillus cereus group sp. N21]MBJ8031404.1 hypothetical protein [Bacillus cereus group sp. N21]
MTREEMIRFVIEGGKEFGENYTLKELEKMSDEELNKEVEWVDYLLGK